MGDYLGLDRNINVAGITIARQGVPDQGPQIIVPAGCRVPQGNFDLNSGFPHLDITNAFAISQRHTRVGIRNRPNNFFDRLVRIICHRCSVLENVARTNIVASPQSRGRDATTPRHSAPDLTLYFVRN